MKEKCIADVFLHWALFGATTTTTTIITVIERRWKTQNHINNELYTTMMWNGEWIWFALFSAHDQFLRFHRGLFSLSLNRTKYKSASYIAIKRFSFSAVYVKMWFCGFFGTIAMEIISPLFKCFMAWHDWIRMQWGAFIIIILVHWMSVLCWFLMGGVWVHEPGVLSLCIYIYICTYKLKLIFVKPLLN